jgi:hypothetical protein
MYVPPKQTTSSGLIGSADSIMWRVCMRVHGPSHALKYSWRGITTWGAHKHTARRPPQRARISTLTLWIHTLTPTIAFGESASLVWLLRQMLGSMTYEAQEELHSAAS